MGLGGVWCVRVGNEGGLHECYMERWIWTKSFDSYPTRTLLS